MIKIKDNQFVDEHHRTLMLRGVNLGGSTKVPTTPDGDTRLASSLDDPANVSFIGRPFPLDEAEEHFGRLRHWGFTFLRLLTTWEAVEHAGPGLYDEAYLSYLQAVVEKAHQFGISVFIDPHQDVYSRFNGGDGAPAWTFDTIGMDYRHFTDCGAAVLEFESGDFYPPLIWGTNGIKLAGATMFTLFFGGNQFAPQATVEGEPVQDYLQGHYIQAMRQVARALKDLPNVVGFDSLNEPNNGYIGWHDLGQAPAMANMGFNPSPLQSMALGAGHAVELDFWQPGFPKARSTGRQLVNPNHRRVWREGTECIWKQQGVWEETADDGYRLLQPDYFYQVDGQKIDFNQDFLRPFVNRYAATIRAEQPAAVIFVESMPGMAAPRWQPEDARNIVHAPHWYDIYHIATNDYSPWMAIDGGDNKLVLGRRRIRKAFRDHVAAVKSEAEENLGGVPTVVGEFGISFDVRNKQAFETGDYRVQEAVLDRTFRALEDNLLNGTIWNYTADNTNEAKDKWNAQDYSIFSRDQQTNPTHLNSGGRALNAVVRPYPQKIAGTPKSLAFDIKHHRFEFSFEHDPSISAPTEIFMPEWHYPNGFQVQVSDGSFEKDAERQLLIYHASADQAVHTIVVTPK